LFILNIGSTQLNDWTPAITVPEVKNNSF